MAETAHKATHRVRNFFYLFFILLIIWLALTSTFSIKRIAFFIVYIVVLFKEIIKANFDVAYRVIHPKMPIKPGIVVIKTTLKQDIAKLILANSITLTPGTFTLDILGDTLLIHWINVKSENVDEATKIIGEKFEKYLRVIFA
jgi:multicomponent Na+:H+ antiporter subunit E